MLASQSTGSRSPAPPPTPTTPSELAAELKPDVVLLDVRLKGASGLDLCAELVKRHPG